jgi:hypothetical protein
MATKRKAISKKIRFEIFKRDNFKCQYCGSSAPDVILHVDHIKPVARGGDNDITNYITACESCNMGKGARQLDDNSMLEKQRKQLEELNERRQQLEMMMKWRKELKSLDNEKLKYAKDHFEKLSNCKLTECGDRELEKIIKKYPLDIVMDSIEVSTDKYLVEDKDGYMKISVNKAFDCIVKICHNKQQDIEKPYLKDIYYIRGILRNRFRYIEQNKAFHYLEDAYKHGAEIEHLKNFAKKVDDWDLFGDVIEDYLRGEKGGSFEEY